MLKLAYGSYLDPSGRRAGGAASVQAAVESAVDAWLTDQALSQVSDDILQTLWKEGLASGDAGAIDFAALKARARAAP